MDSPSIMALFDPAVRADPYPLYHALRTHDPVVFLDPPGFWFLSGYQDISALLRDNRLGRDPRRISGDTPPVTDVFLEGAQDILFLDPPDHTRLRRLVNSAFSAKRIEAVRPRVESLVDELLTRAAANGGMDVIRDLAVTLPLTIICELLGVPADDHGRFKEWSTTLFYLLDPVVSAEANEAGRRARRELRSYFRHHLNSRATSDDTLLRAMVEARYQDDRLTEDEVLSMSALLLVAGHETTSSLIGNGLLALLRNRDQFDLLAARPELAPSAVEEMLRYEAPVQMTSRVVHEPISLRGMDLEPGRNLVLLIGAGNRDPERFADPDRMDITRTDNQHLTFSAGIHFCLGAPLARLQAQAVFAEIARRFPDMKLVDETPRWRETFTLRGLDTLPVSF
ncbi:cytochrome P450 [Plantactinospora sp. B6F1]|uniref:cytochrome P450 n=1 Tax=Plantactinospora sp. B6F1 TaxID=3158971 RepID=UPI0032D9A2B9